LRVLWIATKPPLPAIDGGRLVMASTLDALVAAGVQVTLVAPSITTSAAAAPAGVEMHFVDVRPHAWFVAGLASLRSGRPVSIERHTHAGIADCVRRLLQREAETFDLVHVEQVQAFTSALPAREAGLPCVLRAQNVESALWSRSPHTVIAGIAGPLFRTEARRLRRFEAATVAATDVTIALSTEDAAAFTALAPGARVIVVPPPSPPPAASAADAVDTAAPSPTPLAGDPAFVWIGSRGWPPNEEACTWLLTDIWPAIASHLPHARLHIFGADLTPTAPDARVISHDAPRNSDVAFAPESILLLPLRTPSGVRMRLLQAWSRHIPVIASPAAVQGLETRDGEDVLIARTPREFATQATRLATTPTLRPHLTHNGHATLTRRHNPTTIANATLAAYHEAITRHTR